MVENQHRKISGYRDLSEEEIAVMNNIKSMGASVGDVLDVMSRNGNYDQRWLAIGKTHLQQGFMAVIRAITQPEGF